MSNAIVSANHAQQLAQASQLTQDHQPKPTPKQTASLSLAPKDTVTLSDAARAASQAEKQQAGSGDPDHDGK